MSSEGGPAAIVIGVVGSALILVVLVVAILFVPDGNPQVTPPVPCGTSITIAASLEKQQALKDLAAAYTTAHPCTPVSVVKADSGKVFDGLAQGWKGTEVADLKAKPQVWSPASNQWVNMFGLPEKSSYTKVVNRPPPSITTTPMVLAVPEPTATSQYWPQSISWTNVSEFVTNPDRWRSASHNGLGDKFNLGRTDPATSTIGLHALIAFYTSVSGRVPEESDVLRNPVVADRVRNIERETVSYGQTSGQYLCQLAKNGTGDITAVPTEEKSVYSYNTGHLADCPGVKPSVRLKAVYPVDGTIMSDSPYAILDNASPDQRRVAGEFLTYLRSSKQQDALKCYGFRDVADNTLAPAGKPCTTDPGKTLPFDRAGLNDVSPSRLTLPSPGIINTIRDSWPKLRKPINVLFVMDTSESMRYRLDKDETASSEELSRLRSVRNALKSALGSFRSQDQAALWNFNGGSDAAGNGDPRHPATLDLRPMSADNRAAFDATIEGWTPGGDHGSVHHHP